MKKRTPEFLRHLIDGVDDGLLAFMVLAVLVLNCWNYYKVPDAAHFAGMVWYLGMIALMVGQQYHKFRKERRDRKLKRATAEILSNLRNPNMRKKSEQMFEDLLIYGEARTPPDYGC